MKLKKRLEKLEPSLHERWTKTWEEALIPEEFKSFDYRAEAFLEQIQSMSEAERGELDQHFMADQEHYRALKAWNDPAFHEWHAAYNEWFNTSSFDWEKPDLTLWPHHGPRPPQVPEGVISDLRRGASKWGSDLTNMYAFWLIEVAMALGVGRAFEAYEARASQKG